MKDTGEKMGGKIFMRYAARAAAAFLLLLSLMLSSCLFAQTGAVQYLPGAMTDETSSEATEGLLNPDAEVRGMWIATVYNINYPSKPGLSEAELRAEIDDIVSTCKQTGVNAIYFQVRPSSDALYASELFPQSAYVSGTQGEAADGGFDSLAYMIEAAHTAHINVHAWVNPLRVTAGEKLSDLAADNPAVLHPEWVVEYNGRYYYNAGLPEVRELVAAGVREIVENYAVDGVIFDDYFYPYPVTVNDPATGKSTTLDFQDADAYAAYGTAFTDIGDFRRDSVNKMVQSCYNAVKAANGDCLFGIAPFGIWKNDNGSNGGSDTAGLSSYSAIYCDSLAWIKGGYIDYIAPQIYWQFTTKVAEYDVLVRWWNAQTQGTGVDLIICHGGYRYEELEAPDNEMKRQIQFARSELAYRGSIIYGYASVKANTKGLADELAAIWKDSIIYTDVTSTGNGIMFSLPTDGTTVSTSTSFLIGTADPGYPLYMDGTPVSMTKSGFFSVYLTLSVGSNRFVFTQNGKEYVYTIKRTSGASSGTSYSTMSAFEIKNVTPAAGETVYCASGGSISISCTAPAGSTVTATAGGVSVTLKPGIYPTGSAKYYAEIYTGKLTLAGPEAGAMSSAGSIVITAVRGDETAEYTGAAVSVLGENTCLPVTVKNDYAWLKTSPDSNFYESLTPQSVGAVSYAVSGDGEYYLLSMGGYIAYDDVDAGGAALLPAPARLYDTLMYNEDAECSALYIKTTQYSMIDGAFDSNGHFVVTVYDSSFSTNSNSFSDNCIVRALAMKTADSRTAQYVLTLFDEENFYGFTVSHELYDGTLCTVIRFKNPQTLAKGDLPLAGKTILLDAGHGGNDAGGTDSPQALGENACNEDDLNLIITLKTAEKLRALGAEVILTRQEDVTLPITDRVEFYIKTNPDLALSIHHNAMVYSTDITRINGEITLYWAYSGRLFAQTLSGVVSDMLAKYEYTPRRQELAMCRNPRFPSALIEIGFLTSVEEFEYEMSEKGREESADAIAEGILEYYRAQKKYITVIG